jgi:hypothetical protein
LYWDEIGSIVPIDYEERTLIPYSPDIQYLKEEGEFRPFRPRELAYRWEKVQELMKELVGIIETPKFQNLLPRREMRLLHSRIHRDKVSDGIVDYLEHWGLAQRDKEDWDWIRFENRTALLYIVLPCKNCVGREDYAA